jgi:hypothetical protein
MRETKLVDADMYLQPENGKKTELCFFFFNNWVIHLPYVWKISQSQ